jgi:2,3-bisphosphoglycerate-independent phosphoglycerate mutase
MDNHDLIKKLVKKTESKIVLLVMDGLGGLPVGPQSKTELEMAKKPNMNNLAKAGVLGVADPVGRGITPGSGPGHLALFGYDPIKYLIGRGVLEALGIDFKLQPGDVAIRINFCTVDDKGIITDRRAGRISTEANAKLCEKLKAKIKITGAEYFLEPVKEHRAALIFRAKGLGDKINDTDPQVTGQAELAMTAEDKDSEKTKKLCEEFMAQARPILKNEHPANMMLLRGFANFTKYPQFDEVYKLNACAIAQYPMYKGLARLVGMEVLEVGPEMDDLFSKLESVWSKYDFFFVHVKKTDSAGEDGDWARKVEVIEKVDKMVPRVLKLKPEVLIITGDHSTPSRLKAHSWHPVPVLISAEYSRADAAKEFGERSCLQGALGRIPMKDLMSLALAYALKLEKYGA